MKRLISITFVFYVLLTVLTVSAFATTVDTTTSNSSDACSAVIENTDSSSTEADLSYEVGSGETIVIPLSHFENLFKEKTSSTALYMVEFTNISSDTESYGYFTAEDFDKDSHKLDFDDIMRSHFYYDHDALESGEIEDENGFSLRSLMFTADTNVNNDTFFLAFTLWGTNASSNSSYNGILSINLTDNSEIAYSIECDDIIIESEKVVINYTFSVPFQENADRYIRVVVEKADQWGSSGTKYSPSIYGRYNDSRSYSIPIKSLIRSCPPGTSCLYYAEITDNITNTSYKSSTKSFVVPGECPVLTENTPITSQVDTANYTIPQWFKYTAPKSGICIFTLSSENGLLAAHKPTAPLIEQSDVEGRTAALYIFMSEGESVYLRCRFENPDTLYTLSVSNVEKLEKSIQFNPNGGIWHDNSSSPKLGNASLEYVNDHIQREGLIVNDYSSIISKSGYVLSEWNTKQDGTGIKYTIDAFISPDPIEDDLVLYAQWIASTTEHPHVFFTDGESNQGTSWTGSVYSIFDYTEAYTIPTLEKEGYIFIGWQTSSYGWSTANHHLFPEDPLTIPQSLSFYPIFEPVDSGRHWLIASANGGQFTDIRNATEHTPYNLHYLVQPYGDGEYELNSTDFLTHYATNNLTREGYVCVGWNTKADQSGTHYDIGEYIPYTGAKTFVYAEWEKLDLPENYAVFLAGKPLFPGGKTYCVINRDDPFVVPSLVDGTKGVVKWWNVPNGGYSSDHVSLISGTTVSLDENGYFYPDWQSLNKQWWHFHVNSGYFKDTFSLDRTNLPDGISKITPYTEDGPRLWDTHAYRIEATSSESAFASILEYEAEIVKNIYNPGYQFTGWNTSPNGTGTHYDVADIPSDRLGIELYAEWEFTGDPYVIFGSVGGVFPESLAANETMYAVPCKSTVIAPSATHSDFILLGWAPKALGSMVFHEDNIWNHELYLEGQTVNASDPLVLYANWMNPSRTEKAIVYHSNGSGAVFNSGSIAIANYTETTSHCTNFPQRSGYTLTSWNTAPDGSGTRFSLGSTINVNDVFGSQAIVNLYAQWQKTESPSPTDSVPMFRMYDPNGGEHFYTGSEEERDGLVAVGWNYEGVAFNFPAVGDPVHRLYNPVTGDHLYTMDEEEMSQLLGGGWNYEGVAFNSATSDQVPQYRLWNPNARRGAWHFTGSTEERDWLISLGWQYQGIGWYSEWK